MWIREFFSRLFQSIDHVDIPFTLAPGAIAPIRATAGAAGWDLHACLKEDLTVASYSYIKIPIGVSFQVPPGWEGQIRGRSGFAAKGYPGHFGTLDSDYTGEVCAIVYNHTNTDFIIKPGDRVAQILFKRVPSVRLKQVSKLTPTVRGNRGFGSTGVEKLTR